MWSLSLRDTPQYQANSEHLPGENWLMSEKMDGQYMYWPGKGEQMYARGRGGHGDANLQHPPESFLQHLPAGIALEGELAHWNGAASRGHAAKKDGWKDACLWVFDAPELTGTYQQRLALLTELEKGWNSRYVRVVPQFGSYGTSHAVLVATLNAVVARGGEGLMIRDPEAAYEFADSTKKGDKHTDKLFKFKPFDDVECKVIGANQSGCRGYQCVLPNGVQFGLSSIANIGGVQLGRTIVNIHCQGFLGNGKPQYPTAISVRKDRPWEDYVTSWKLREGGLAVTAAARGVGDGSAAQEDDDDGTPLWPQLKAKRIAMAGSAAATPVKKQHPEIPAAKKAATLKKTAPCRVAAAKVKKPTPCLLTTSPTSASTLKAIRKSSRRCGPSVNGNVLAVRCPRT
jgi:DNA ligase-1